MKIVLISGLSGSGKSVALKQLEDLGYFCVDNLPLEMLPSLVLHHIERADETKLGVSVDVRSGINIQEAQEQIQYLRDEGHQVEVLFVEAEESVLVRRFSETRRGHPLSGLNLTLLESLQKEREWLFPLKDIAYCIDTSKMNAQQLRYAVQQWLNIERRGLLVILESFGFKYGVPNNADFMFDMRSLPNPYYDPELRPYTGMDAPHSSVSRPAAPGAGNGGRHRPLYEPLAPAPAKRKPQLRDHRHRLYRRTAPFRLCRRKTRPAPARTLRTAGPPQTGAKPVRTLISLFRRPFRYIVD